MISPEDKRPSAEKILLEVNGLSKSLLENFLVEDIHFKLPQGHVLGLLGENGSGKSSLLQLLAGLIHPDQGNFRLLGFASGQKTKTIISYLPSLDFFHPKKTFQSLQKDFAHFFKDFDQACFLDHAKALKLPLDQELRRLSKGYGERGLFCLTLSRKSSLYLLDEPMVGLDPLSRDILFSMLLDRLGEGRSMIIASQQISFFEGLFDEVCFLKEGKILRFGPAESLREEFSMSIYDLYRHLYKERTE